LSGRAVRIDAQAKLNLHLRVLAREDSGFHSIETIFHRIDLADEVTVEITSGERTLDTDSTEMGSTESNLVWRAALAFAEPTGWPAGFRIELRKRIPVGAGLGGGSADAAAVLRALNSLSPRPVDTPALLLIAASLGADVPFLASDSVMALAWGRGERLLSLAPLPRREVALVTPDSSVPTADAYRWLDEDRAAATGEANANLPLEISALDLASWDSIARFARNDFESHVIKRHPAIAQDLESLRHSGARMAQMTGSGSTIFGVFDAMPNNATLREELTGRVTTTMTSIDVVQPASVG